jgi:hypothetical protein
MQRMKKIFMTLLVLATVGGLIGYKMFNEKTPDIVSVKPNITIDAASLLALFNADTVSASKQCLDKIIEVTGQVKSIDTSGAVILGAADDESSVVCGLDRRHLKDYENVQAGSVTTIQGRCTGYDVGEEILGVSLGTTVHLAFAGLKNKQ